MEQSMSTPPVDPAMTSIKQTPVNIEARVFHVMEILMGKTVEVHSKDEFKAKLTRSIQNNEQLRIKLGADPSSPDLHLGHAVVLRKLRQFQDLGHKVIMIIGDFTATIGDPTGRSKTRPALTLEQTRENAKSYIDQICKVLSSDPSLLEVRFNSEWLEPLGARGLIQLAQSQTVAQMLQRADFANRFKSQLPIAIHELLYPLLQAYDSYAITSDVELGGTDQTFNCLLGREIQKSHEKESQVVITMPLLVGLDGKDKMSKSLQNHIGIADPPDLMFKKAMKIPDDCLLQFIELCTDFSKEEGEKNIQGNIHEAHKWLARELVRMYHGDTFIAEAESRYSAVASGAIPQQMEENKVTIPAGTNSIQVVRLAHLCGITSSIGEAKRLITNGGLKLDGTKIDSQTMEVETTKPVILQRGKDKFVRVTFES